MAAQMNPFANGGGAPAQAAGGYTGLGGIMSILQGGINASQYGALADGATGSDGMAVGGMHGAFAGLSPYAVHFLATSGLLDQQKGPAVSMVDASGAPLTGGALALAKAQQMLQDQAPAQYKLADGISQDQLAQLFAGGIGGHSAYAKGFGAGGPVAGPVHPPGPGVPNRTVGGPYSNGIVGYGRHGGAFHSAAAARAAGRYHRGVPTAGMR